MKYNLSYWDSLIAETMKHYKIFTIITENEKDFKKIPWLTVINPFKIIVSSKMLSTKEKTKR